jgi:hypothetical protein
LFYVGITRVKADPTEGRPGTLVITYPQQMQAAQAFGANIAFASQSGATANLIPSRFIGELGPIAPKPRRLTNFHPSPQAALQGSFPQQRWHC